MPRLSSQAREKSFRTLSLSLLHIVASCAFVCTEYFFGEDYFVLLGHCAAQLLLQISFFVGQRHRGTWGETHAEERYNFISTIRFLKTSK